MDVIFYADFEKNTSSTKKPKGSGTTFQCTLKDHTSVINPVIRLGLGFDDSPAKQMYAYIPEFDRYYYVQDWEWAGGIWEASLRVDVLATYRGEIGKSRQYVIRSSARNNDNITDSRYPANGGYINKAVVTVPESGLSLYKPFNGWKSTYAEGTYIIGVVNGDSEATMGAAVSYYCVAPGFMKTFMNQMLSSLDWMNISTAEISEELLKTLYNPMEYIVSCIWLPIELDADFLGSGVGSLKFGFWELPIGAYRLAKSRYLMAATCACLRHPQAESEFSYFNLQPFTRYTLMFPGFGEITIDPLNVFDSPNFDITLTLDMITGSCIMELKKIGGGSGAAGITFQRVRSQIGVPIQLAQLTQDVTGVGSGALGAVSSLFRGDIGGIFDGITSAVSSTTPRATTLGSTGSIAEYGLSSILLCEFCEQVEINNAHAGKPLFENHRISSLGGYILCENPSIELNATAEEISKVKDYMSGGFYYE